MNAVLKGKKILIGVTGGIAAYKIPHLVRLLIKQGAEVRVIMTERAKDFVSPLVLSTLSKNEVLSDLSNHHLWNNHVELSLWADVFLIAPLTANTLAKMAVGMCDNLLLATYLSSKKNVFFAPAMDLDMYRHPTTQNNIKQLVSYGNHLIPSEYGELASGLVGEGRMSEPDKIVQHLVDFFTRKRIFKGKRILITAGSTQEAIDPVRYIGNHSSGKMGVALANCAAEMGAEVTLILGPSKDLPIDSSVKVIRVESAQQMYQYTKKAFINADIAILSAAVADFTPKSKALQKIKKHAAELIIELIPTKDILAVLGQEKKKGQLLIGFALETENETENALRKLQQKNLDAIVLNSLRDKGAGFGLDTNKVTFIYSDGRSKAFPLKTKQEVAQDILLEVSLLL